MAEENIWSGASSQLKNFGPFALCVVAVIAVLVVRLLLPENMPLYWPVALGVLAVIGLWTLYRWLVVRSTTYRLTTERLLTTRGILSTVTDSLELYRVRDFEVTQSFSQKLLGLQDIALLSTDESSPRVMIEFVPKALQLEDKIRAQVEECRLAKRVRTVDMEDDSGHAH